MRADREIIPLNPEQLVEVATSTEVPRRRV
jgi:hypothetical protein